jgi:putative Mg2+ transporter-C (MgtC) family protein
MNHQLLTVIDALGVKAVNGQLFVFQQFFNLIQYRSEGVEELLSLLQEMEGIRSVETKSN